jgi:hypothetical protein
MENISLSILSFSICLVFFISNFMGINYNHVPLNENEFKKTEYSQARFVCFTGKN